MTEVSDYRIAAASREEWAARALKAEEREKQLYARIVAAQATLTPLRWWLDTTNHPHRIQRDINTALEQLRGKKK